MSYPCKSHARSSILRRQSIPRLNVTAGSKNASALPSFLTGSARALPINPSPVMGPEDRLEHAIASGVLWQDSADPVDIGHFDAREDVLSVMFEDAECDPVLALRKARNGGGVQVLANGKPIAEMSNAPAGFSLADVRVLRASAG